MSRWWVEPPSAIQLPRSLFFASPTCSEPASMGDTLQNQARKYYYGQALIGIQSQRTRGCLSPAGFAAPISHTRERRQPGRGDTKRSSHGIVEKRANRTANPGQGVHFFARLCQTRVLLDCLHRRITSALSFCTAWAEQ